MLHPKISIILPTFNSEKFICSCLSSLVTQSFEKIEIIIQDGMSTDNTVKIIQEFLNKQNQVNIRIVSEKDNGIYDAMNKAIKMAKGDYIYFLGSDDILIESNSLQTVYEAIEKNNFPDFVYGNVLFGETNYLYNGEFDICKLYDINICHQAIFYKRTVFNTIGFFDLSFPALADWHFNIKCFLNSHLIKKYIPVLIARYAAKGFSSQFKDPFLGQKESIVRLLAVNAEKNQYHLLMRYLCNTQKLAGRLKSFYHQGMYHLLQIKKKIFSHTPNRKIV
ncbi:glycosyltransferase family 2 protein [Flavisolibacter tropicus]|uniref:glycosyltransferase family 2 protein n=1 Tax=Flavisolibacter tropicus TaxID=1492898 RepID=UPI0008298AA8|nr:glycosyltransferase family 2 protein [Flavisolibacter tropicus]